jgi:hypothetical protein
MHDQAADFWRKQRDGRRMNLYLRAAVLER